MTRLLARSGVAAVTVERPVDRAIPESAVALALSTKKGLTVAIDKQSSVAPQVGFEPTTLRLTAGCSTIELLRNNHGGQI